MITLDSNVLVYLYDNAEPRRQAASLRLVEALLFREATIGLQTIGELTHVLRRKLKRPAWEAAEKARTVMIAFGSTFAPTETAVQEALSTVSVGHLSYWDALLVASAREAGCSVLLSEDMHPGRIMAVEIVKPFDLEGVLSPRARELLDL